MNDVRCIVSLLVVFAFVLAGCAHPERIDPREPVYELPPVSTAAYTGPRPTILIHQRTTVPERGRAVEVQIEAPSGGHRLILDHGDVIEGEALLFLTIEQPAADEVVTMALETIRSKFETDRRFDIAKVYIRSHRRGEIPPELYRFAGDKRIGHEAEVR